MSERRMTAAERLVKQHGATYNHGTYDRATGLTEETAKRLASDLSGANYQVIRPPFKLEKSDKWELTFR